MSIKGCKKQFIVKRLIDSLHDSRSRNARGDHWIGEPRKNDNSFVEANQNEQITRGRGHSEKRVKRNNNGFERAVSKWTENARRNYWGGKKMDIETMMRWNRIGLAVKQMKMGDKICVVTLSTICRVRHLVVHGMWPSYVARGRYTWVTIVVRCCWKDGRRWHEKRPWVLPSAGTQLIRTPEKGDEEDHD